MTIDIYGIGNCDTVKKTRKLFEQKKIDYQFHDYKKETPDAKKIKTWLNVFGSDVLINRRGTTWRNLSDNDKHILDGDSKKNEKRVIALLIANSSVIKRPIIEHGTDSIIGFDKAAIDKLITTGR